LIYPGSLGQFSITPKTEFLATMKLILKLKQYVYFEKILYYTVIFTLSLMCLHINTIQEAIGSESQNEPNISLNVKNQRLGDVLKNITQETGIKFMLNDQWSTYPVNASIENMPLNRGLKLILKGLNHVIIYESDKIIKILVYGNMDSRETDSYPIQPFSTQIQDNQQESVPLPESSPELEDDLNRSDDSSEETGSSENTEDKNTENEISSDSGKEDSSEEAGTAVGTELDQDSSGQKENTNEQDEQENAAEDASPESPQEQN
jgi:hypothetical protein